jgi:hypothetical protein
MVASIINTLDEDMLIFWKNNLPKFSRKQLFDIKKYYVKLSIMNKSTDEISDDLIKTFESILKYKKNNLKL